MKLQRHAKELADAIKQRLQRRRIAQHP